MQKRHRSSDCSVSKANLLKYCDIKYITRCSRVHIEILIDLHLVKKFLSSYGTWSLITPFTKACHLFLSSARSIHSIPPSNFLKIIFNIIIPYIPTSSKQLLFLWFPRRNSVCNSPLPLTRYMPHPSCFDHKNNVHLGVQTRKLLVVHSVPHTYSLVPHFIS